MRNQGVPYLNTIIFEFEDLFTYFHNKPYIMIVINKNKIEIAQPTADITLRARTCSAGWKKKHPID